jgi:hypothetical protein
LLRQGRTLRLRTNDIPAKELAKESDRPKPREAVKRDNDNWLFKGKKVTTLT